ncbi:hypothetical protein BGZ60DRAFT_386907, partial [Tricladium varicosporioides]
LSIAQFYNMAKSGNWYVIEKLLVERIKPDLENFRYIFPFWIAAANGTRVAQVLLDTKLVNMNSKSILRRPPLFLGGSAGS